jgi:cobalt-zinc-cadmium efflux system outer membrane protein
MKRMTFYRQSFFLFYFVLFSFFVAFAQSKTLPDTLQLSIDDAEKLFLEKNFELLVSKFEVNSAEAAIVQAKLWDNPSLNVDQGAYNWETGKWFDVTKTGETAISIEQLIHIARQRNKNVQLQKINAQIATYQFYDLMRTLRYELRTNFYSLYFLRQSVSVYDGEIASLNILVNAYQRQYQKGNIAFKELARLQALQFNLENERTDLLKDISEKQNILSLFTGDTLARIIVPVFSPASFDNTNATELAFSMLLDSAFANRNDLKMAQTQIEANQTNLALQKSLRTPDLHLGANYDRAGSYITDYNSVSLGIDLPFFNRNQGNIKAAE